MAGRKKKKKTTALDLVIKGSAGLFKVGKVEGGPPSVEVRFLQTHVHLATGGDHDEKLLEKLRPVREVFPQDKLSFEQIMQRDIDDARVSTELVPYLLEEARSGLVKLFPPIIVVVLPRDDENRPSDYYDAVKVETEQEAFEDDDEDSTSDIRVVRSGVVGREVFELRQVVEDGETWDHDYAELRINTSRVALVVVDGQHRAMALLALYRNLKSWPDNAKWIAPYYSIWKKDVLDQYDLQDAKLPVMFCVFPGLDGRDTSMPKVHEACRSVFLALNKNARQVTRARTALLDDADIISAFMRDVLSTVKDQVGSSSETTIRLWNVELDAEEDRTALSSPVAITGVNHLFGLLERLMFAQHGAGSISASKQNFWKATRLDSVFDRLHVTEKVERPIRQEARRKSLRTEHSAVADLLVHAFRERIGKLIVRGLDKFAPYRANNEACLEAEASLRVSATADFYRSILFEGQGQASTFRTFGERLTREFSDALPYVPGPEFKAVKSDFQKRREFLQAEIDKISVSRREKWIHGKKVEQFRTNTSVCVVLDKIYRETLTTAAFQNALFLTFFLAVHGVDAERRKAGTAVLADAEVEELFDHYLKNVNEFFSVRTEEGLRQLVGTFFGSIEGDHVVEHKNCLRGILIPGELKPEEWAKFRVILIELWQPGRGAAISSYVRDARRSLRGVTLATWIAREERDTERERGVAPGRLDPASRAEIQTRCAEHLASGLALLGGPRVSADSLQELLNGAAQAAPGESDNADEIEDD